MKLGEGVHVVRGVLDLEGTRDFYETLGFVKLDESTTPNNWVLYTDGRINLLLDEGEMNYTGLLYFNPDFNEVVAEIEDLGYSFQSKTPRTDFIPESAILIDPEGFGCNIVNERYEPSMKPDIKGKSKVRFGKFGELATEVKDLDLVVDFWTNLGYTVSLKEKEPHPWAILIDGLMVLGFHQEDWGVHQNEPALTYFDPAMDQILSKIEDKGIALVPVQDLAIESGNGAVIAPDGLRILLFKGTI